MNAIGKFIGIAIFFAPSYLLVFGLLKRLYADQIPDVVLGGLSAGFAGALWGILEAIEGYLRRIIELLEKMKEK